MLQEIATLVLQTSAKSRRWVRESPVPTFTGKAVSQLLPIPLARFFTRGLYDDLRNTRRRLGRYREQNIRLVNAGPRHLQAWKTMLVTDGRLIYGGKESWSLHTDAADVGFGGTLGTDMTAGAPGEIGVQATWSSFLRLRSITHRDLVAVRIRLHVDNMAFYYIVNNMI